MPRARASGRGQAAGLRHHQVGRRHQFVHLGREAQHVGEVARRDFDLFEPGLQLRVSAGDNDQFQRRLDLQNALKKPLDGPDAEPAGQLQHARAGRR